MGLLDDTSSPSNKPTRSSKKTRSTPPSSAPDSATLQTIQNLQSQIADLEAKETARGELTKAQADKLTALETELAALKAASIPAPISPTAPTQSEEPCGRVAPWSIF